MPEGPANTGVAAVEHAPEPVHFDEGDRVLIDWKAIPDEIATVHHDVVVIRGNGATSRIPRSRLVHVR